MLIGSGKNDVTHEALWSDVVKYSEEKIDTGADEAEQGHAESDSPWVQRPSYLQLQKVNEILTDKAIADTRLQSSKKRKRFTDKLKKAGSYLYQWLKSEGKRGAVVIKDEDGNPISYLPILHEKFRETWETIFNMHKFNKPNYEDFEQKYEKYIVKHPGAPTGPPNARQLFLQAQNFKPSSSGGMDGTTPFELRILPEVAWKSREQYLKLSYQVGKSANV